MDQAREVTVVKKENKKGIPVVGIISIVGDVCGDSQVCDLSYCLKLNGQPC